MPRRTVADFLESFVLPLVRGGELHIGEPLSLSEVADFEANLVHASAPLVAVDEARHELLAELVVKPPTIILDNDELRLAAALYNVLFLVHPDAGNLTTSRRARSRVAEAARQLAGQPLSRSRRRVLARHGLMHNVYRIVRADIRVTWWTGHATFLGRTPPSRLTSWRTMRRVREDETTATFADLLCSDEATPVMAILLRRSPLTQVLDWHPQAPALHWEDAVFALRDAELARAICYRALAAVAEEGLAPEKRLAAPARFAAAFEQMLERNPSPADIRAVAAFLVHLSALIVLDESLRHERGKRSPLLTAVLAPERASKRPRGLTSFLAVPEAIRRIDRRIAEPPGITANEELAQRWSAQRDMVAEGVGEAVVDTLAGRIARRLGIAYTPTNPPPQSLRTASSASSRAKTQPNAQIDAQPKAKLDAKPDATTDATTDAKPDAKPDAKINPKIDETIDAKINPKPEDEARGKNQSEDRDSTDPLTAAVEAVQGSR